MIVATITVLTLGFEPFVQQSLRSPLRNLEVEGASSTLRISTILGHSQRDGASNASLINDSVVLQQALYADEMAPLQPLCSGSTCEWPTYYTASVCSSCEDMLNETVISNEDEQAFYDFTTADYLDDFEGFSQIYEDEGDSNHHWNVLTNYSIRLGESQPVNVTVSLNASIDPLGLFEQNLMHPEEVVFGASTLPGPSGYFELLPNMTGPQNALGFIKLCRSEDGLRPEIEAATKCVISLCARKQVSTVVNGSLDTQTTEQDWGHYYSPNQNGYSWTAKIGEHRFHLLDTSWSTVHLINQIVNRLVG